jgi:protein-disulfide isomerase
MFEKYQNFFAIIIAGALIAGVLAITQKPSSVALDQGFETEKQVTDQMSKIARDIGINKRAFEACLSNETFAGKIEQDITTAAQSGVQGTPTFFVIKRSFDTNGNVNREQQIPIVGARDLAVFEQVIKTGIAPAEQGPFQGEKIVFNENDHWKGPRDAEIVIVKYSDIDCPFCKRAWTTIDQLIATYPQYAFVYRHSPILSLHPFAGYKAAGSECAKSLGGEEAFWNYLDAIAR